MIQGSLVEVHLRGFPIEIWTRARAHHDAINREFEIMRASAPAHSVPRRLLSLIEGFDIRFGDVGEGTREELDAAAERGVESTDVTFRIPPEASEAMRELGSVLAEVDAYCLAGEHLMTLATPPELLAFREWLLDELIGQIDEGSPPLAWADYVLRAGEQIPDETRSVASGNDTETIVFEGSLDLATVSELRDAIQERRSPELKQLVVDLTQAGFVDSVGIGLLVTTHNRLEEEGMTMRLIVPPRLKELLRLSGLVDLLQPEDPPPS